MKKILFLILTLNFIAKAQTPYYKLLATNVAEWDMFDVTPGVSPIMKHSHNYQVQSFYPSAGKYIAKTDTSVLGKTYKKFIHVSTCGMSSGNVLEGFMREDSLARKVYFLVKGSSTEDLLYDYSLNVGDSAYYNFPISGFNFPKAYYKVKSINTVTIACGARKQYKLIGKNGSVTSDTLIYIEGVGSLIHPAYLYFAGVNPGGPFYFSSGCSYPYYIGLACKLTNGSKFFQSCTYTLAQNMGCINKIDSCTYCNACGGINEFNIFKSLTISPNPANADITLDIRVDNKNISKIELTDVTGRKVKEIAAFELLPGSNSLKIETLSLGNGTYFLKVSSGEFTLSKPVIISH